MHVLSKVHNSSECISSYFINILRLRCETTQQEAYFQTVKFTENTTTLTAFLLTSTDRHLVIRSCVLFLLRRQSSANCRGVSASERLHPMATPQRHTVTATPTGRKGNSSSPQLPAIISFIAKKVFTYIHKEFAFDFLVYNNTHKSKKQEQTSTEKGT